MIERAIIIGPSTAGKTTLLKILKEQVPVPIMELDDVLTEMNGGTYPRDEDFKMTILAPQVVNRVLGEEQIIFFTNADYFSAEELEEASSLGFSIIQLVLPRERMEERNENRVQNEGYEDISGYFDGMLAYQEDLRKKDIVHHEIITDQPIDRVLEDLKKVLGV